MVRKVNKVIKGLEKASKTHKKQAATLKKHVASMKKPKARSRGSNGYVSKFSKYRDINRYCSIDCGSVYTNAKRR